MGRPRAISWKVGWPTEYVEVKASRGNKVVGFIPRAVVEGELGITLAPEGQTTWFTREQSEAMHAHPLMESP